MNPTNDTRSSHIRTLIACVIVSCIASVVAVGLLLQLPLPWKVRFLQAETLTIGGGTGQGTIVLSAARELDGMVMATFKGASGAEALTLSVLPKGNPTLSFDAASGKQAMILELSAAGQPRIRMMDSQAGTTAWSVTLDKAGQPVVTPGAE